MGSGTWPSTLERATQGVDYIRPFQLLTRDLKVSGPTLIVPPQSGRVFIPLRAFLRIRTVSALTVPPILRLGNNGNRDNIAPLLALTGAVAGQVFTMPLTTGVNALAIDIGTTGISIDVQTAATATTMTADVFIDGQIV